MKLKNLKSESAKTLNVDTKKEFTVDTSNQMIVSILRDKLYSNKVAAVCREVASNSRDANREAGRGDVPVVINISQGQSLLDDCMTVSFKDSGIGISPSRIDNVFLKYGSSTKRDSNVQTGGFGIGAKTPFAYTNEFLISTISEEDGKRLHNVYQAVISNEGGQEVSQLLLVSSNETTESTGTEIVIPVEEKDVNEFVSECLKATILWDVQPELIVNGVNKMVKLDTLINTEDFKVIYGGYKNSLFDVHHDELFIQVDGIPYKISYSQIERVDSTSENILCDSRFFSMSTRYYYEATTRNTVLVFETGELTMSASRENIEYTQENIDKILSKVDVAEKHVKDLLLSDFDNCGTTLKQVALYNSYRLGSQNERWFTMNETGMLRDYFKQFGAKKVIEENKEGVSSWGGLKKMQNNKADFYRIPKLERFSFTKKNSVNSLNPDTALIEDNLFVVRTIMDSNSYAKNLTLSTMLSEQGKSGIVFMTGFLNFENRLKGVENKKDFVYLLEEAGIEVIHYKDVEKTKITRGSSVGGGTKKPTNLGSIFARNVYMNRWATGLESQKLKMEYDKKDKVITDFDLRGVEEGSKNVIIPIGIYADLKDLDRKKADVFGTIQKQDINKFTIKDTENEEGELEKVEYEQTCKLLLNYNYNLIFVKSSDLDNVKNDKTVIVGLHKASKDLMKNKQFIKDLVNNNRKEIIKEVNEFAKDSYRYKKWVKDEMNKSYLLLGGLDVTKHKTPMQEIETVDDSRSRGIFRGRALSILAERLSEKVKGRDYSKYLTADMVEAAQEKIAKTNPVLHYLFSETDTTSNWNFNTYDVYDKDGGEVKSGVDVMKEKVAEMIKSELKKMKK
jgi:hypothetical protein